MPRRALAPEKEEKERGKPPRGLWEREPGSGVWWIRYRDANGKLQRELVGRKSDAEALLNKRRNERRVGKKMPENIRTAPLNSPNLPTTSRKSIRSHTTQTPATSNSALKS